jgi:hypothetical protein
MLQFSYFLCWVNRAVGTGLLVPVKPRDELLLSELVLLCCFAGFIFEWLCWFDWVPMTPLNWYPRDLLHVLVVMSVKSETPFVAYSVAFWCWYAGCCLTCTGITWVAGSVLPSDIWYNLMLHLVLFYLFLCWLYTSFLFCWYDPVFFVIVLLLVYWFLLVYYCWYQPFCLSLADLLVWAVGCWLFVL